MANVCGIVVIHVGVKIQGYQANYRGNIITLPVWEKPCVSLERFITDQSREFISDLTISSFRLAVRREVLVLVTGLHF